MENFVMIWGTVSVLLAAVVQWVGRKIPGDIPILNLAIALILQFAAVRIIVAALGLPWELSVYWQYIAGGQIISATTHALGKTAEKNGLTTLGVFATKAPGDHAK